jgi:hypothetical protein
MARGSVERAEAVIHANRDLDSSGMISLKRDLPVSGTAEPSASLSGLGQR